MRRGLAVTRAISSRPSRVGSSHIGCTRTSRPRSAYCSATATATATATCQRASPWWAASRPARSRAREGQHVRRGEHGRRGRPRRRGRRGRDGVGGVGPVLELVQPVVQRPDTLEDQRAVGVARAVMESIWPSWPASAPRGRTGPAGHKLRASRAPPQTGYVGSVKCASSAPVARQNRRAGDPPAAHRQRAGWPSAGVLVRGEPGIGKTELLGGLMPRPPGSGWSSGRR